MNQKPYYSISSLERGLRVLETLAEKGSLSVSELAAQLGMHRSASHRFLATLKGLGYVVQDPANSRYRLSFRLFELGIKVVENLGIRQVARPIMEELANITNETVNLGHLDGKEIIYIEKIESTQILRMGLAIGARVPVHCSALGKSILAFLPERERDTLIRSIDLTQRTPNTITSLEKLYEEIKRIRRQGYAVDDEEMALGIRCVAAPVFDYSGYPRYAVSIEGPTSRMTDGNLQRFREAVKEACNRLSEHLGRNG